MNNREVGSYRIIFEVMKFSFSYIISLRIQTILIYNDQNKFPQIKYNESVPQPTAKYTFFVRFINRLTSL